MIYLHNTRDFSFENTAITIGKFDGLHKGHRALIERLMQCKDEGLKTVVMSLDFAPDCVELHKDYEPLLGEAERIHVLEEMGVDIFISYPFSKNDAMQEPTEFIDEMIIGKLGAKSVVVGDDFRFGKDRAGDPWLLQTYGSRHGYKTITLKRIEYADEPISSSRIRRAIADGRTDEAELML